MPSLKCCNGPVEGLEMEGLVREPGGGVQAEMQEWSLETEPGQTWRWMEEVKAHILERGSKQSDCEQRWKGKERTCQ